MFSEKIQGVNYVSSMHENNFLTVCENKTR